MIDWLVKLAGREFAWRFGRAVYTAARGEGPNDMASNGERFLIQQVIRAGGGKQINVVDCGGNLGDWSAMVIAEANAARTVTTINIAEPAPAAFAALVQRFADNSAVQVHNLALSDKDGTAAFHMVSPTGGTNSLVASRYDHRETISVRTVRAEEFLPSIGVDTVDLFKIDTEGHDMAVIEGMGALLERHAVSVIQFEYNHRWLSSRRSMLDIFDLAHRYGYRVGRADSHSIALYDCWNAEIDRFFEWNYLLVTPAAAAALGAREMRWGPSNTLVTA